MATVRDEENTFLIQLEAVRESMFNNIECCKEALENRAKEMKAEVDLINKIYKCQDSVDELDRLKTIGSPEDDQRMRELKARIDSERSRFREVTLEWDEHLKKTLSKTGSIRVVAVPDYKNKSDPVRIACKHSNNASTATDVFTSPRSIAIDPFTDNIFICDQENDRVLVFDESLDYLSRIHEKLKQPFGICICSGNVYITQIRANTLNVYSTDGKYKHSIGAKGNGKLQFDSPKGVDALKEQNAICVCDWYNNRVQCLDWNLAFRFFISDLNRPVDIKLTQQEIVVLIDDSPCLRFFDYSGKFIRQIITRGEESKQVNSSFQFCLDVDCNILMTDKLEHCVVIFSNKGELLCKFGQKGEKEGEFIQPIGIAIDYKNRIIVGSSNSKRCIQMF